MISPGLFAYSSLFLLNFILWCFTFSIVLVLTHRFLSSTFFGNFKDFLRMLFSLLETYDWIIHLCNNRPLLETYATCQPFQYSESKYTQLIVAGSWSGTKRFKSEVQSLFKLLQLLLQGFRKGRPCGNAAVVSSSKGKSQSYLVRVL